LQQHFTLIRRRRKLRNNELNNLYVSPNLVRIIKCGSMMDRIYSTREVNRTAYGILVGTHEVKKSLGNGYGSEDICLTALSATQTTGL
jgi:hypothetical protein